MRCLFCDKEYHKESLNSLLIKRDKLCPACRKELKVKHRIVNLNEIKVETFFDYEGIFKSLLLQYKECYDEALSEVFLYSIEDYIRLKYYNYHIVYIPSSKAKLDKRGFHHLKLIFESLGLKEAQGLRQIKDISQENKTLKQREDMLNNYIYEGNYYEKILIVDDVLTTGSSIYGAYKAIRKKSKKVKCLVLAIV